jgi:hypothetical protein
LQQNVRQRHGIAYAAAERDMKLANQRDPYEPRPGYTAGDSAIPRSNIRNDVMGDEVVRPLDRCINRK